MKFIKNFIIWLFNFFKDFVSLLRKEIINPTIDDSNNPWNGLASYSDPDNSDGKPVKMFCGRDNETFKLTQQIKNQIFVTVYGKSGKGKTSLLNAGVCPKLREEQFYPISIRLGMLDKDISFQDHIISEIEKQQSIRFEVIDVVKKNEEKTSIDYLWNYFARHRFYKDYKLVFPVIILDQFEEVFYNKQVQKEGREESYNREEDAAILLKQIYFMMDEGHVLPDKEIDGNLYEYYYNFRFVVTIREDDLYKLEDTIDANYLNLMKENRFRLRSITKEGARDVILKPSENMFVEEDKDKIVDKIIEFATDKDNTIGSNVLSLLCSSIYVQKRKDNLNEPISLKYVEKVVSENPLEKLYSEATKDLSSREKAYMENKLVDVSGRRASVTKADYQDAITNGDRLLNGTTRILQESNGKIELIHNSFCSVLEERKAQRKERRQNFMEFLMILYVSLLGVMLWFVSPYTIIRENGIMRYINLLKVLIFIPICIGIVRETFNIFFSFLGLTLSVIPFFFSGPVSETNGDFIIALNCTLCAFAVMSAFGAFHTRKELKQQKSTFIDVFHSSQLYFWTAIIITLYIMRYYTFDNYYFTSALITLVLFFSLFAICLFVKVKIVKTSLSLLFYLILPIALMLFCGHFFAEIAPKVIIIGVLVFCLIAFAILTLSIKFNYVNIKTVRVLLCLSIIIINIVGISLIKQVWVTILVSSIAVMCLIYNFIKKDTKQPFLIVITLFFAIIVSSISALGYNPILIGINPSIQVGKWRWRAILKETDGKTQILEARSGDVIIGDSLSRVDEKGCLFVKSKYDFMSDTCSNAFFTHRNDTLYYGYYPDIEYSLYCRKSKQDTLSLSCFAYKDFILKYLISGENVLPEQYPCYLDWLIEQEMSKMKVLLNTNFRDEKEYKDNQKQLFKLLDNVLSSCLLKTVSVEVKECNDQKMKQLVDVFNVFVREHGEDIRKDYYNFIFYLHFVDNHNRLRYNEYDYITGFEKVADMYMKVDNDCEIYSSLSQILPLLKEERENAKSDCSYQLNLGHKIERLEEIIKKFQSE